MDYANDKISVADCSGRYKGRLNFSILSSWIPTMDWEVRVDDEFEVPFDYFQQFEVNSEFNYYDTGDPTSIYRFKMLKVKSGSAILKIQKIFKEQGYMWLYENAITWGKDWGVIEFLGVDKRPDLKLIKILPD